jgi:hypothetical protein
MRRRNLERLRGETKSNACRCGHLIVAVSILDEITCPMKMKVPGSGRKQGSQNILQRELREQLQLHLANELNAIQARIDELPLVDRYKVAAMLFKLSLPTQTNDEPSNAPVIVISKDL